MLKTLDANKDGKLAKVELPNPQQQKDFKEADLDIDGFLSARDWDQYRIKRSSINSVMAVRLGGKWDMTQKNGQWVRRSVIGSIPLGKPCYAQFGFSKLHYLINRSDVTRFFGTPSSTNLVVLCE